MMPIQPILIVVLVFCVVFYYTRMRSQLWDRLLVFLLGGAGVAMVASPSLSIVVARWLGVGRGVDVVIYFGLVAIGFVLLLLISKTRELQAHLTALARETALQRTEGPKEH